MTASSARRSPLQPRLHPRRLQRLPRDPGYRNPAGPGRRAHHRSAGATAAGDRAGGSGSAAPLESTATATAWTTSTTCAPAPKGLKVDAHGCVIPGQMIELNGVTFDFNKARLTTNAQAILDTISPAFIGPASSPAGSRIASPRQHRQRRRQPQAVAEARGNGAGIPDRQGRKPEQLQARGYGKTQPLIKPGKNGGRPRAQSPRRIPCARQINQLAASGTHHEQYDPKFGIVSRGAAAYDHRRNGAGRLFGQWRHQRRIVGCVLGRPLRRALRRALRRTLRPGPSVGCLFFVGASSGASSSGRFVFRRFVFHLGASLQAPRRRALLRRRFFVDSSSSGSGSSARRGAAAARPPPVRPSTSAPARPPSTSAAPSP